MKYIYATANIQWLPGSESVKWPIQGFFCRPALFSSHPESLFSLCIYLEKPVHAGDTVEVPISLMALEKSVEMLSVNTKFELKPDGEHTVATGRVTSVVEADIEEIRRIFHSTINSN